MYTFDWDSGEENGRRVDRLVYETPRGKFRAIVAQGRPGVDSYKWSGYCWRKVDKPTSYACELLLGTALDRGGIMDYCDWSDGVNGGCPLDARDAAERAIARFLSW